MNKDIVNVASVPQRSPFRYPGGKTWLVPHVRRWLSSLPQLPELFIEPFLGGGIVSLTIAFEGYANRVRMVELDADVAAAWQTMLGEHGHELAERIVNFDMTIDHVRGELAIEPETIGQRAFQTILKNRSFHGGILAPGSSLMKKGENGKGIGSRWYPATLKRRILEIAQHRDKLEFIHGDGMVILAENANQPGAIFFIDPPYTAAGKKAGSRLYRHSELDHQRLFENCLRAERRFPDDL